MHFIAIIAFVAVGQQVKPDYNGVWALNSSKSVKAIQEGLSAANSRLTLTVTPSDVTIVHRVVGPDGALVTVNAGGWNERTTVCGFGASPTENIRPMRVMLCSARWDGNRLVITSAPKPYPTTQGSDGLSVTTYSITGTEMRSVGTGTNPDGQQSPAVTLFYEKAR